MATKKLEVVITADSAGARREFKGLGDSADSLGGKVSAFSKVYSRQLMLFGAAVVAGFGVAAKAAMDFESSMNEVYTLLPDISGEAMDAMKDQVKDFSVKFGVLPNEVIPALYQAISAGIPEENVFSFLETAQMAARGGVTDLTTAVDGISSAVNAYGADVLSAAEASDAMFTAVRLGKTTFEELSANISSVTPLSSALGVEFTDVAAALATITSQGANTAEAATQLRSMFTDLSKEGNKTSEAFKEIAGVGFREFIKAGGNTQEALQLLEQHAIDTGVSVQDLFGNVRGGMGALALTGAATDKFAESLSEMEESAGATDAAFDQMNEGLAPLIDKLKATAAVMAIDVGETMLPALTGMAEATGDLARGFGGLPDPVKQAAGAMTGLMGAGALALGVYGKLAEPLGKLKGKLEGMGGAAGFAGTHMGKIVGAAGLASIALVGLTWEMGRQAREAAEAAAAVDRFSEAIKNSEGDVEGSLLKQLQREFKSSGLAEMLRDTSVDFQILADAAVRGGDTLQRFGSLSSAAQLGQLETDLKSAAAGGDVLAIEMLRVYDAGEISNSTLQSVLPTLNALGIAFRGGISDAEASKAAMLGVASGAEAAGWVTDELADHFDDAGDAAADAASDLNDLVSSIKDYFDDVTSVLSANINFETAIDDLTASIIENKNEWDISTEAGRKNMSQLISTKDAAIGTGVAMLEAGESVDAATYATLLHVAAMEDSMRAAGLTEEEIEELIETMGLTPEAVATEFQQNAPEVQGEVENYQGAIDTVPLSKTTYFYADTSSAWSSLTSLGGKISEFASRVTTGIGVRVPQADGGVYAAANGLMHAGIARSGAGIMWNEPETQGESFIPHAPSKRARSLSIWEETGRVLGADTGGSVSARGGDSYVVVHVDGSVLSSKEELAEAVRSAFVQAQRTRPTPILAGLA